MDLNLKCNLVVTTLSTSFKCTTGSVQLITFSLNVAEIFPVIDDFRPITSWMGAYDLEGSGHISSLTDLQHIRSTVWMT